MNVTPPVDTDWMLNFGYAALEELAKNSGAEPGAELTLIIYDATAARIPSPGDTIHAWVVACTTHGFIPALVGPPEFVAFDHWNIHASEEASAQVTASDAPSPTDPTADPGPAGSADADSTEPLPLDDGGASDEGSVGSSPADSEAGMPGESDSESGQSPDETPPTTGSPPQAASEPGLETESAYSMLARISAMLDLWLGANG